MRLEFADLVSEAGKFLPHHHPARFGQLGGMGCIGTRLSTSGRRWEQRGVWRTIFLMWRLRWAYWRGVPVAQLAEAYR